MSYYVILYHTTYTYVYIYTYTWYICTCHMTQVQCGTVSYSSTTYRCRLAQVNAYGREQARVKRRPCVYVGV